VRGAGATVADCEHDIPRQLLLNVEIELLNDSLLEVAVLRLNRARIGLGIHRRTINRSARDGRSRRSSNRKKKTIGEAAACAAERSAHTGREWIHLRIVRGVLPQSLPALIPRGIMDDPIAPANSGFSLPIGFQANPMRGSRAVLSNWIPTRPSVVTQTVQLPIPGLPAGTYHLRLATSKFACRLASSVSGD